MNPNRMEQEARQVVQTLQLNGFPAFFVGGCVRDKLAGRTIKDMDIATRAKPEQVMDLFPRTVPTGLKHGTVTVLMDEGTFEVTTFRVESGYADHRRPTDVRFVDDLQADLERRDFTMNAMAMDLDGNVIDPFGGRRDMEAKLVRCVGDPQRRFEEDALRMLRCIRFAAEFGYRIDDATWASLQAHRRLLRHIAMERVGAELERIVGGSDPVRGLRLFMESGLTDWLQTDLNLDAPFWSSRLGELDGMAWTRLADAGLRWGLLMLYMQYDARSASKLMRGLRYSNARVEETAQLLDVHRSCAGGDGLSETGWKLAALRFGPDALRRWLLVANAASELPASFVRQRLLLEPSDIEAIMDRGERWIAEMPVLTVRELDVKGNELKAAGLAEGREIGQLLSKLLQEAAIGSLENRRQALLEQAARWKRGGD